MEVRVCLVLLFTFVTVIFGLPTALPEPAVNTHEERTLSTELQPPSPDEKEHHATIYVINLYAIKNGSTNASENMLKNEVAEAIPDLMEPLVSVLLVVEDDENEEFEKHLPVDLDEFAEDLRTEMKGEGYKVDKIELNNKEKVIKMKLEKEEAQSMIDSALKVDEKRYRQKRTLCLKCGGGWGGGHHGGGHHHHGGGYGGGCGYRGCGGGHGGYGGYGGGYAQSSASAHASAGGWGKK